MRRIAQFQKACLVLLLAVATAMPWSTWAEWIQRTGAPAFPSTSLLAGDHELPLPAMLAGKRQSSAIPDIARHCPTTSHSVGGGQRACSSDSQVDVLSPESSGRPMRTTCALLCRLLI
jgi:hypothetical protein